jgi:SAM-dependent methyltransferase
MKKYSKSSSFYSKTKKDFFTENDNFLRLALGQNKIYASQPKRIVCKICSYKLGNEVDFSSHGIDYAFCNSCNHLNGLFDDTKDFADNAYLLEGGEELAKNYIDSNYKKRVTDIYLPKFEFLANSANNISKILDVGCGGGHFVSAALQSGINAVGIDVNSISVNYGNDNIYSICKLKPLTICTESELLLNIRDSDANVISAIGVIEHLREPQKFFDAFKHSKAKYLFYSVPMFSFSVIIENVFPQVFPRHLSEGHTHLFTDSSIAKMNNIIGVKPVAEWRFGADINDLYRGMLTMLSKNKASERLCDFFERGFFPKIDEIQSIIDRNHFCSEIHCVAEKL